MLWGYRLWAQAVGGQPLASSHPPHLVVGEQEAGSRAVPRSPPTGVPYPPLVQLTGVRSGRAPLSFHIPWLHQLLPLASVPSLSGEGEGPMVGQGGNILAGEYTPGFLERVGLCGREKDAKFTIPLQKIILPSSSGWQNSVLPLLLQSLQPELVFATNYKVEERKEGL